MHRKRFLVEVRSLFDESLFVDSQQVLSGRVVALFPVPAFVNRAIAYEPDRKLRRLFGSFYFLGHLVAGVTHLVQGQGRYPSISSNALGVAVFALNFRHDFVLAAVAADFEMGEGLRVFLVDAFGNGFELFGHRPLGVVVAAGYHGSSLNVAVYQDLRCQQDLSQASMLRRRSRFTAAPHSLGKTFYSHAVNELD